MSEHQTRSEGRQIRIGHAINMLYATVNESVLGGTGEPAHFGSWYALLTGSDSLQQCDIDALAPAAPSSRPWPRQQLAALP